MALTRAEADAIRGARYGPTLGGYYPRLKVADSVRASLMAKRLLGKRSLVLTPLGEREREKLLALEQPK